MLKTIYFMDNLYKKRILTSFQLWLGKNYNNLPTDSGSMTKRANKYLKENPDAFFEIPPLPKLNQGDRVNHSRFGDGTVKEVRGEKSTIEFDSGITKELLSRFALFNIIDL